MQIPTLTADEFTRIADYGIAFVLAFIIMILVPFVLTMGLAVWRSNVAAAKRQQEQIEFINERDAKREERESARFDRMFTLFAERIAPFGDIAKGLQTSLDAQMEENKKSKTREAMYLGEFEKVRNAIDDGGEKAEEIATTAKNEIIEILKKMGTDITEMKQIYPSLREKLTVLENGVVRIEGKLDILEEQKTTAAEAGVAPS
jgi:Na+-transporting methylmalonyl-CoA/oxaloacetate decarboxylase gamma subunit